jgi:hypothetical protein
MLMNSEGLGPSKKMLEDRSVLRWGGLAGILSAGMTVLSLLTIVAFSQPLFVPVQSEDICGPSCYVGASLPDFPASRAALMIHHAFYVLTIMLIAILVVSLYRVLSRKQQHRTHPLWICHWFARSRNARHWWLGVDLVRSSL